MSFRLSSLLLLAALLVGCAGSRSAQNAALEGTAWRLVALGDERVPADAGITLAFDADSRVSGSAGCNRYFGTYEVRGAALAFSQVGSTMMACEPTAMTRESAFLDALQSANRADVEGTTLTLRGGTTPLRFEATELTGTATLTGMVTYLPRIALAPDAVVHVALVDVSSGAAATLAEETIQTEGRQVPIPFSLAYDPSRIDDTHRYAVRAEIRDASGDLRWTTDDAQPVLTQSAPTDRVEVRVVQVDEAPSSSALAGTAWRLVRIERGSGVTIMPDADEPYTLTFTSDGRYAGQADCNRYGGAYDADASGRLDLERGLTTLAACAAPSVSGDFFALFNEVGDYTVADGYLYLAAGGTGTLVFAPEGR